MPAFSQQNIQAYGKEKHSILNVMASVHWPWEVSFLASQREVYWICRWLYGFSAKGTDFLTFLNIFPVNKKIWTLFNRINSMHTYTKHIMYMKLTACGWWWKRESRKRRTTWRYAEEGDFMSHIVQPPSQAEAPAKCLFRPVPPQFWGMRGLTSFPVGSSTVVNDQ